LATSEEKQELVDQIKDPRFFRIQINGYGGESSYMTISKEAYSFWKAHTDEYGDYDLARYMLEAEDEDFDFEELEEVPEEAKFLKDDTGISYPWYEPPTEFEHTHGVIYDSAAVSVEEIDSDSYTATAISDPFEVDLDDGITAQEYVRCENPPSNYTAQMYSMEKGCFFDGIIETHGDFNAAKLKVYIVEYLNGEETITNVHYNGVEVENMGGDSTGKGYSAAVNKY